VARRRLTIKHIDPWSVLKFGSVANLALLAIFLLFAGVAWFIIDRLGVVEQVCGIAIDVGFSRCGINAGNLFRALVLLGLLWVVVQSAVLVFLAFLHNLIADLTGGLVVGVVDDSNGNGPVAPAARARSGPDNTAALAQGSAPGASPGGVARASTSQRRAAAPPADQASRAQAVPMARSTATPSSESTRTARAPVERPTEGTGRQPAERTRPATGGDELFGGR
jgi:hypothetical protein